jgi:hypothetical protein
LILKGFVDGVVKISILMTGYNNKSTVKKYDMSLKDINRKLEAVKRSVDVTRYDGIRSLHIRVAVFNWKY